MPTFKETVAKIKEELKDLADIQRRDKARRKPMPEEFNEYGYDPGAGWAAMNVQFRKSEITALLNFYLAVRGKLYRHNIVDEHNYKFHYSRFEEKYVFEEVVINS